LSMGASLVPVDTAVKRDDTLVVRFAPQLDLLAHAVVVLCHGGLNTVLESLARGIPLVIMPFADDQFGVAFRVARTGAGVAIDRCASVQELRRAVAAVISDARYGSSAVGLMRGMSRRDGLEEACQLIEDAAMSPAREEARVSQP
jgi:zeaxanthin glucosyltransferase